MHYAEPADRRRLRAEKDGRILLCKRSIEPRYGYWTVPAGFMELGETRPAGRRAKRSRKPAPRCEIGHLFASVDVVDAGQVHLFFTGKLVGDYAAGHESLDARLFAEDEIPWDDIAFRSGTFALKKYFEDRGRNNGVHFHELRRIRS